MQITRTFRRAAERARREGRPGGQGQNVNVNVNAGMKDSV